MFLSRSGVDKITTQYYSHFCCTDLSKSEQGVYFICSAERDRILKGYGCKYALYVLLKDNLCVVTYSPMLRDFAEALKNSQPNNIIAAAENQYHLKKERLFIFHQEKVKQYGNAKILCGEDYPYFEAFFRKAHPKVNPDGWLSEYFSEKTGKGYFTGYFKDDRLVSVCDTPDMPYMEDQIQHTGIITLKEERQKGYGKLTAALATHHLLQMGICPQWECNIENKASFELAKSIGYKEFGKAYILEE